MGWWRIGDGLSWGQCKGHWCPKLRSRRVGRITPHNFLIRIPTAWLSTIERWTERVKGVPTIRIISGAIAVWIIYLSPSIVSPDGIIPVLKDVRIVVPNIDI